MSLKDDNLGKTSKDFESDEAVEKCKCTEAFKYQAILGSHCQPCGYAVQQRHSQLQCGNTVNFKLFLLQGILVPSLHYGCELWGMHTPRGEAQKARVALPLRARTVLMAFVSYLRFSTDALAVRKCNGRPDAKLALSYPS